MSTAKVVVGHVVDSLRSLPDASVRCVVTSPPYWGLRDYGNAPIAWAPVAYSPISVPGIVAVDVPAMECSLGNEDTPESFIGHLVGVFREVRRVLTRDGTLWLNLGDSYTGGGCGARDPSRWPKQSRNDHMPVHAKKASGLPEKNLVGIPWRVALALQADGWTLRQDIIWHKPNPMPESVVDRCTKAHEYLFLLTRSPDYYFDADALKEAATGKAPGNRTSKYLTGEERFRTKRGLLDIGSRQSRNRRSVWTVATRAYRGAHFATFPPDLVMPCVLAGSEPGDTVLDPFSGSGTTGAVATGNGRNFIGCELNPNFAALSRERIGSLITTIEGAQ